MNTACKFIVISAVAFGLMFARAEISGTGFHGAECEGNITATFVNEVNNVGISDIKVAISVLSAPELGMAMASTDDNGRVDFRNLCPGIYTVEVGRATIPENLEFAGVVDMNSGESYLDGLPKLMPLELNVAGTRTDVNYISFELLYTFRDTSGANTRGTGLGGGRQDGPPKPRVPNNR